MGSQPESSAIKNQKSRIPSPFDYGTNFSALTDLDQTLINDFSTNNLHALQRTRPPIKDKRFFHKICASAARFLKSDGSVRGSISLLFLFTDPHSVYEVIAWILENYADADFQTFLVF